MTRKDRRREARVRGKEQKEQKEQKVARAAHASPAVPGLPGVRAWVVLALILATVLAYAPALSAPFVMDDATAIAESATFQLRAPPGSPVSGRPVVAATLALNHAANRLLGVDQRADPDGPDKAVGYRLLNILLHLCTGALLFGVLRRAIRERTILDDWRVLADPLAGAVCALWLLHPIQSEVIDYIVQRTESLASLCYVAVLYASLRAWEAGDGKARMRWYAAALAACVLGMGSKEIVISAPLAVVLYDRAFRLPSWSAVRRPGHGRGWFYAALAAVCVLSYVFIAAGARGETAGFGAPMKWYVYFYSQCWAIAHYLRLVAWPNALAVDYGEQAIGGARGIPGLVLLALFGAATLVAWTRLPRWGWFAFLGSWFFMLLAPSSSVVPIPTEVAAERRIYLALAAVLVLVVVGAEWLRRRVAAQFPARRLAYGFGGIAAALAVATAMRSHTYTSPEQLWRGVVKEVPGNLRGYVNLGSALFREQPPKYAEAESVLTYAVARDTTCMSGCEQLAYVMSAQGRLPEARALLERAVAHSPANAPAEQRLALLLMKADSFTVAVPHLEHVAVRYPDADHLVVLAVADFVVQRQRSGIATFQRAAQLYPDNAEIRKLATTLYTYGRSADAVPHLKELAISLANGW